MISDKTLHEKRRDQIRMKLKVTRAMMSRIQECLTPADNADSPIWPAMRPEKRAWIRQARGPPEGIVIEPRPDRAPVVGMPSIDTLAKHVAELVVRPQRQKGRQERER
jgi:hypothetical protein